LPQIDEAVARVNPSLLGGKLIGEPANHCWIFGLPYHIPGAFDRRRVLVKPPGDSLWRWGIHDCCSHCSLQLLR
jgi:hypothetical protein